MHTVLLQLLPKEMQEVEDGGELEIDLENLCKATIYKIDKLLRDIFG